MQRILFLILFLFMNVFAVATKIIGTVIANCDGSALYLQGVKVYLNGNINNPLATTDQVGNFSWSGWTSPSNSGGTFNFVYSGYTIPDKVFTIGTAGVTKQIGTIYGKLDSVIIEAPANKEKNVPVTTTLRWTKNPAADYYVIWMARNTILDSTIDRSQACEVSIDTVKKGLQADPDTFLVKTFIYGVRYFWDVSACDTTRKIASYSYAQKSCISDTFTVERQAQSITFNALSAKTYGDAAFNLTATASSGLSVSYTSSNTAAATVSGNTVTIVGAGSTTITASQAGNVFYLPATDAQQTLTVNQASATVTLSNLSATYDGNAKAATVSTSPTVSTVTTYNGSSSAPVNAGSYTVSSSVTNPNYQGSATGTLVISKATATVSFGNLSPTYDGTAKSATATTTPAGLTVGITYDGSSTAPTNAGSYVVLGTISDDNYSGSKTDALNIAKASQTIIFESIADKRLGDAAFTISALASSALAVTFTSSNTAVATVSGTTITIVGVGKDTITASQAGNSNFNAATAATQAFTIVDASTPIVTVTGPAKVAYGKSIGINWVVSPGTITLSSETLSVDGTVVTGITATTRSYSFAGPSLGAHQFKVTAVNASSGSSSYGQFSCIVEDSTAPVISLSAPTSNDVFMAGTAHPTTWAATDNVGIIRRVVSYSADSGQTWVTLSDEQNNTGTYSWAGSFTVTNKARVKVTVYDAAGNISSALSGRFWIAGVPVISSAETTSVHTGEAFRYKILYTVPGAPPGVTVTVISKPSWVSLRNDSLAGTAPDVGKVDTVRVKVSLLDVSDTLILKIRIIKEATGIQVRPVAKAKYFGIKYISGHIEYGVLTGRYELRVCDVAGRVVFSKYAYSDAGLSEPVNITARGTYILRLTQGNQTITTKKVLTR